MSPRIRRPLPVLALAGALALAVVSPAAGVAPGDDGAARPPAAAGGARTRAPGGPTLRNLPTSLLVTLWPGATPDAADRVAAGQGLVRVAWNPDLRTAQYVAITAGPGGPRLAVSAAVARAGRVDGRERGRLATLSRQLRGAPGVAAAAPPARLALAADPPPAPAPVPPPDDTYWASQWGAEAVGVRSAWAVTRGRPEIVVAILDTGVDLTHPDLAARLVLGTDIGADDPDPTDENGHGTHVAGIVAAVAGNARGVAGVAPGVVVMPVKVMDPDGFIWDVAVAEGIAWAVARGARVVNLSLGGSEASATIAAAVDHARARGVVVVAAAGNQGGVVAYPAAYAPVLAVAAVADRDPTADVDGIPGPDGCRAPKFGLADLRRAPYSNLGPEIDLAAPGTCILSTYPAASGGSYAYLSGTSMAAPFVAAVAALVLARDPSLTVEQVEAALRGTALDLGAPGADPETGAGLVQAGPAVATITPPPADGAAPVVAWSGIRDGTLVRDVLAMQVRATDASPVVALRVARDGRLLLVRRNATVPVGWGSAGVPDGLHAWTASATDAGLLVGTATVRVLVANRRPAASAGGTLTMTSTGRAIAVPVTIRAASPVVARVAGPAGSRLVVSLVDATGRVVAQGRGTGAAAIARTSLPAGRYVLRGLAVLAAPGLELRLAAAWFR